MQISLHSQRLLANPFQYPIYLILNNRSFRFVINYKKMLNIKCQKMLNLKCKKFQISMQKKLQFKVNRNYQLQNYKLITKLHILNYVLNYAQNYKLTIKMFMHLSLQQINQLQQHSFQDLLREELLNPGKCLLINTIIFSRAKTEICNPDILEMTLTLLDRQGDTWVKVVERYAQLEFKLVYAYCIKNQRHLKCILNQTAIQGQLQHQKHFQSRIQQVLDQFTSNYANNLQNNLSLEQVFLLYTQFMQLWAQKSIQRSLPILQQVQKRLFNPSNFMSLLVNDSYKFRIIKVLCKIISLQQKHFAKKLKLREFYKKFERITIYVKTEIANGLLNRAVMKLTVNANNKLNRIRQQSFKQSQEVQQLVMFLMQACKLQILEQAFVCNIERISTQLSKLQIIPYSQYSDVQQLMRLQSSLLHQISSDDFPALLCQLLSLLSSHILSFLPIFLFQLSYSLQQLLSFYDYQSMRKKDDIVFKICLLRNHIINRTNTDLDNMVKEIIKVLEINIQQHNLDTQYQTIVLTHYYNAKLDKVSFQRYHNAIFNIIKFSTLKNMQNYKVPLQCLQILIQQTQSGQQNMTARIKKKVINKQSNPLILQQHVLWISDKIIQLLQTIAGSLDHNQLCLKLYKILSNLLTKYEQISQRSHCYYIKVLTKHFLQEISYLQSLKQVNKNFQKVIQILHCIKQLLKGLTQDTYIQCQQSFIPIINILNQHYLLEFQDDILEFVPLLLQKANTITYQLSNFIVYSKNLMRKTDSSITLLQPIIILACTKPAITRSIISQCPQLIQFFIQLCLSHLQKVKSQQTVYALNIDWSRSTYLIQLFIQTFSGQFNDENMNTLARFKNVLIDIGYHQGCLQILMSIYYIDRRMQLNPYQVISYVPKLSASYSIRLIFITLSSILCRLLKQNLFNLSVPNNEVYQFLNQFIKLKQQIEQHSSEYKNSDFDKLPMGSINVNNYIKEGIYQLKRTKNIDDQEYYMLKTKLIDNTNTVNSLLGQLQ